MTKQSTPVGSVDSLEKSDPLEEKRDELTSTEKGHDLKKTEERPATPADGEDEPNYPSTKKLAVIMVAIYLAMFLVALDRTIIATAIPQITNDFNSLADVGWYGSAYLLTFCAFQLFFGRVYTFYNIKWVFLSTIALFEIGSAISGAAPNSIAFIVGRAIAGLGSAGVFSGCIIITIPLVPLAKRPMFQGFMGAIFGVSSVIGPLLGGAFTASSLTWRWCFYINLPIGAASILIILFILQVPPPKNANTPIRTQISQLDPIGTMCLLPSIVCLLLALQWGGSEYAWSSWRIIVLLTIFSVTFIAFVLVQMWKGDLATVPPSIVKQRSILAACWFATCVGAAMFAWVYYIPIWFQAIKGVNAVESGIMSLPLVLSLVVASILTGASVSNFGYYVPPMILSSIVMSIGAGLLTTLKIDTGSDKWIAYQFLAGFGLGMGMQQASVAAQTVLPAKDVPTGTSLMFFTQSLSGAIFISVAQNLFTSRLVDGLSSFEGLNPSLILTTGATDLRKVVPPELLEKILVPYNDALMAALHVSVVAGAVAIVGAAAMEWKSVKTAKKGEMGKKVEKSEA